jgi:hypothetical protein
MGPGPRKLKQSLPVIVGFGVAGRKHCLFSILPELICYRHGHPPVPPSQYPHAPLGSRRLVKIAHLDRRSTAKRTTLENSKVATTRPAAAFLKLLKLLQPRAAVVKICELKRGNVTPSPVIIWDWNRYMID